VNGYLALDAFDVDGLRVALQHLASDIVHYREYKIPLQPDRLTSRCSFKAAGFSCSKYVSAGDNVRCELVRCIQELRTLDPRVGTIACGKLEVQGPEWM
jgi:hypothetical protein